MRLIDRGRNIALSAWQTYMYMYVALNVTTEAQLKLLQSVTRDKDIVRFVTRASSLYSCRPNTFVINCSEQ